MAMSGEGVDTAEPQFVDSITQAIQGLREGTENLNAGLPPADLAGMFSGLQMNDVMLCCRFEIEEKLMCI